jgi:MFS family permease
VLKASRISVSAVFLLHGMIVSNWLSRIPAVQQQLGLRVNVLGVALLGASLGGLIAMSLISRVISRFGSARVTTWASLGFCAALPLPGLAQGAVTLTLFLIVYGAMAGSMDVSMNTQAVELERAVNRPVVVGFHALYSLGGMLGAAMGGLAAARRIPPLQHLPVAALILAVATVFATRRLLVGQKAIEDRGPRPKIPLKPLIGLAVVAFCVLLGEGAVADWSAVYLNRFTGQGLAATGYAAFSLMMAAGRFTGDRMRAHLGSVAVVRWGSALAAVGLGVGLAAGNMIPALIGFACAGAGWATTFPIAAAAAGHKTGSRPEAGVAAVTAVGFFAFLISPPLIGFLAEAWTLRAALFVVVALSAIAALLAPAVSVGQVGSLHPNANRPAE